MRARTALLVALGCCALGGCVPQGPPAQIARRLGGERTEGAFVSPTSYEFFVRAEVAVEEQRWEAAVQLYRLALAGAEEDPLVLSRLAIALARAGRPADSEAALARALELDPESEAAFLAQGDVALLGDDREAAVAAYERAAAVAPESEEGPLRLAGVLRMLGAAARADAVLARLASRGGPAGATAARARLAAALGSDDAEAAGEAALALLRVAPVRAADVREAAVRALAAGKVGLAARLVSALPRRDADTVLRIRVALARGARGEAEGLLAVAPPEALGGDLEAARLWLAVGQPERAYELAREVAALHPAPDVELVAGQAALAAGSFDEAAAAFARVPGEAGAWPEARRGLAEALRASGLPALAGEVLARPAAP
jgi:tetratricopeptide (TPR) repeat protein